MEDFSIGLDRNAIVPAIPNSDVALLTRANVVIGCVEPFIGMFVESRDEDRFFGTFFGAKFVTAYNWRKYEVERFAEPLQSSKRRRRNWNFHHRRIVQPWLGLFHPENLIEAQVRIAKKFRSNPDHLGGR